MENPTHRQDDIRLMTKPVHRCVHQLEAWEPGRAIVARRRVRLDLPAQAGRTCLMAIEEDSPKCYSRIRSSCSCEAIWDGIDRTCEAPLPKIKMSCMSR